MHELVDRLVRGLDDIYQALVRLDHEILAAIAINKRTSRHIVMFAVGRQGHRSHDPGARPYGGIQNFLAAVINDPAVVGF